MRGQQKALGSALQEAGVVQSGQVWVSNFINNGPAKATIDHLIVIAKFFDRTPLEMFAEAGIDLLRHPSDQRSGSQEVTPDAREVVLEEQRRELLRLRETVKVYGDGLDKARHVAGDLIEITAVREQDRGTANETTGRGSGRRKTG